MTDSTPTPASTQAPSKVALLRAWAAARTKAFAPRCSGYCIGTKSAETLVEDLACAVHGIEAQEAASTVYPDRQAWLDALAAEVRP